MIAYAQRVAKRTTKKKASGKRSKADAIDNEPMDSGVSHPAPVSLDAIKGQDGAIATLRGTLGSGRVHHCWIFHGPSGVGKFTAALAFAAMLLDPELGPDLSGELSVDPDSRVQKLLRAGGHPDLHIIRKELSAFSSHDQTRNSKQTRIPIRVVQEFLIRPAALGANVSPGGLASKVFIVDEAELLAGGQNESQNALLKTLEEPPEGTVIFLVTSNEERLLPTIRSRSQRVAFHTLDDDSMRGWLGGPGKAFTQEASASELDWLLASYASGAPGKLVDGLESRLYEWHSQLEPLLNEAARGIYPPELGGTMHKLVDGYATAWQKVDEKRRSKDAANRAGCAKLFALLAENARAQLRGGVQTEAGLRMIDAIQEAERRLASNVSTKLVMEGLATGIADPAYA